MSREVNFQQNEARLRRRFPWPEEWHDRVLDYAEHVMGMELGGPRREPPEIVGIAYEALTAPLPQGWTMDVTPKGKPYYWYCPRPFPPRSLTAGWLCARAPMIPI